MEWFAVSSVVTTSLAWAGADARARGAWVSLADVCRQTMTEGRIRAAKTQISRVCRLARVGVGDLRAAINAGLIMYDEDDLVLAGWDLGKEREAARAAQRSRESRQRQQRQELPTTSGEVTDQSEVVPVSVREPFGFVNPNANPNFGTEKRRREKTRPETPPSPVGVYVGEDYSRTGDEEITATAATAQDNLINVPESVREPFANGHPNAPGVLPDCVREPFGYVNPNAHPNASPNAHPNAIISLSQESLVKAQESTPQLTPKRSAREAIPALRAAAINDHALGVIVAMGGCVRGPGGADYTAEWQRELQALDAREVLAMNTNTSEPLRLPSGFRKARERWRQLPLDQRRTIVRQVCSDYDIPCDKRPASAPPALKEQPP
jgi:hypothetical protein